MGTDCAPLLTDLFLFCYERGFVAFLSNDGEAEVIQAFNLISRQLYAHLNIDNPYFWGRWVLFIHLSYS